MAVPSTIITQQRGGDAEVVVVVVAKARTGSCCLAMCPTLLANYINKNSCEQKYLLIAVVRTSLLLSDPTTFVESHGGNLQPDIITNLFNAVYGFVSSWPHGNLSGHIPGAAGQSAAVN